MTGFSGLFRSILSQRRYPYLTILITTLAAILVALPGFRKTGRTPFRNYVVLVSMDGFRWDYSKLYKTPNLDDIARAGVKADRLIPSFPTKTFPNHYSIATGLYPDHHGLVDNNFPAPELGLTYRIGDRNAVENAAFYGGEPVWVTAEKQGVKTASFFWVGSEAPVKGMHPGYWKKYDGKTTYGERIDSVIKWLGYPPDRRPELVTLYFDEPDITSTYSGPESGETARTVSVLDSLIGVLRYKISGLPDADKINLIVLSDHGMGPISPERYTDIKQFVPDRMIVSVFGGNPVFLINPAEGKADSVVLLLNEAKGLKAWRKSQLPEKWHYGTNARIPEIVVVADSSWSIGTRPDDKSNKKGAHGYDNYDSDMAAIFYAAGPAFRKGYSLRELNNIDIYYLICKLLDITPAINDGNPAHIEGMLR
jgi:predicted AlkP superfamily pyrophosphatase or phosphodiesterase